MIGKAHRITACMGKELQRKGPTAGRQQKSEQREEKETPINFGAEGQEASSESLCLQVCSYLGQAGVPQGFKDQGCLPHG